jgi:hypothetical protein
MVALYSLIINIIRLELQQLIQANIIFDQVQTFQSVLIIQLIIKIILYTTSGLLDYLPQLNIVINLVMVVGMVNAQQIQQ